jgi:hypothetical protein
MGILRAPVGNRCGPVAALSKLGAEDLLLQVLDDSTKEHIRRKVDDAAVLAIQDGHPVQVSTCGIG